MRRIEDGQGGERQRDGSNWPARAKWECTSMMAANGRARAKRTPPCTAISTATMRRTKIATRRNVDDGGALHDDGGALHDDGGECAKMTDDVLDGDGDTTVDDDSSMNSWGSTISATTRFRCGTIGTMITSGSTLHLEGTRDRSA